MTYQLTLCLKRFKFNQTIVKLTTWSLCLLEIILNTALPTCPVDAGKRLKVSDGPGQDVPLVERGKFCWDVAIGLQVSPGPGSLFTNRVI